MRPARFTQTARFTVSPDMLARARRVADQEDRTLSELIRDLLRQRFASDHTAVGSG